MSKFGQLTLSFTQQPGRPARLDNTRFLFSSDSATHVAQRGLYGPSFKWSSGVQALSVLLLHALADAVRAKDAEDTPASYVMCGQRPSMAASLNDALTKKHRWLFDMFGSSAANLPRLNELLQRRNPDFHTDREAPVEIWLDAEFFPAERIIVNLNGEPVRDVRSLDELAQNIHDQWTSRLAQSSEKPKDELQEWFQSFDPNRASEQFERFADFLAEDATLEIIGNPSCPFLGSWRGRDRIVEAAVQNYAMMDDIHRSLHTLITDTGTIVQFEDNRGVLKATGKPFDYQAAFRFTMSDGMISKIVFLANFVREE